MASSPYRIRASNLAMIHACPGSLQMQEKYPEEEGEEAREGTAAHDCFAFSLQGLAYTSGDVAENGVVITDEMVEHGEAFADLIRSWDTPYKYVEQQMPAVRIHPLCGGTPDAWAWFAAENRIVLADYKYGHREVPVIDNEQLCGYTEAISELLQINGLMEQHIAVEWIVYQPRFYGRGGPWKRHSFMLSDLRALSNLLRNAAAESVSESPRCIPSEACRDCTGRKACVALQRASARVTDFTGNSIEAFDLTPEQAGRELVYLKQAQALLDARIEGLEVSVINDIRSGKVVRGWEISHTRSSKKWNPAKVDEARKMARLMGINIDKPADLITPTQAEKLGFTGEDFGLTETHSGKAKLIPATTLETSKIFGDK